MQDARPDNAPSHLDNALDNAPCASTARSHLDNALDNAPRTLDNATRSADGRGHLAT